MSNIFRQSNDFLFSELLNIFKDKNATESFKLKLKNCFINNIICDCNNLFIDKFKNNFVIHIM